MLVVCPFPVGVAAGQRLKFEQYYDDWRAAGWQVDVAPFMGMGLWRVLYERGHPLRKALGVVAGYGRRLRGLLAIRRYDLVYCHMYATPLGRSGAERLLRKLSRRLIYDVEDNVVGEPDRVTADHPNPLLRYLRGADKYRYLIREADHVITSSPELERRCSDMNRYHAATYISSSLDTRRFVPRAAPSAGPVTIGWTGTFSTGPNLELVIPALRRLAAEREFKVRVIGNFDFAAEGFDLEVIRWTAEREVADLQAIDIGIYPHPDDEWVIGKSGLKAITYMAMGIPCVASAVGMARTIIRDGENGLLVRTEDEWVDALRRLIDDPELRRRLGEQAREDAVANYSTDVIAKQYRQVLDEVMSAARE
jgi:glycosyltransferase involved in cell wall biosynthesis